METQKNVFESCINNKDDLIKVFGTKRDMT